jgi:ATP-dependent Clp protease ATP-binding subunit ClpA
MQNNPEIEQIIDAAVKLARDRRHEYVMTEHVLLSLIRYNPFRKVLEKFGTDVVMLDSELEAYLLGQVNLVTDKDVQPKKPMPWNAVFNRALTQVLVHRSQAASAPWIFIWP